MKKLKMILIGSETKLKEYARTYDQRSQVPFRGFRGEDLAGKAGKQQREIPVVALRYE